MINKGLFSSKSGELETPQDFFNLIDDEFHFQLDSCATKKNAKCSRFFSKGESALKRVWKGVVWMNPPYGRGIGKWVKKAWKESQNGAVVVCLLPSRTDTAWWHDYCMRGEIRFIRGRLRFSGSKVNAPFPSAIVIFRKVKK